MEVQVVHQHCLSPPSSSSSSVFAEETSIRLLHTRFSFWFEFMYLRDVNAILFTELTIQNVYVCVCVQCIAHIFINARCCLLHRILLTSFHIDCFFVLHFIAGLDGLAWVVCCFCMCPNQNIYGEMLYDTKSLNFVHRTKQFPRKCS